MSERSTWVSSGRQVVPRSRLLWQDAGPTMACEQYIVFWPWLIGVVNSASEAGNGPVAIVW